MENYNTKDKPIQWIYKMKQLTNILYCTYYDNPLGHSLIACTDKMVVQILIRPPENKLFEDMKRLGYHPEFQDNPLNKKVKKQLDAYFSGTLKNFSVPLQLHGTEFQNKVWRLLTDLPFGKLISYGELAAMAGHPRAARAVGSAMAKNQIPIIIPCHRVIPSTRKLGNYTGGVDIKTELLKIEGIIF